MLNRPAQNVVLKAAPMPSCREIDPLFAPYVDGEATADERADRRRAPARVPEVPASDRAAVRRARDRARKAVSARARPTSCGRAVAPRPAPGWGRSAPPAPHSPRFPWPPPSCLIVGGVLLYSLTGLSPTVLAAQLTLDHVKCFAVHDSRRRRSTCAPARSNTRATTAAGCSLPRAAVAGLQLVGMRRCFCGEGVAAHAMYRLNGRPVSLYVIPDAGATRASADVFGHDAVIWSRRECHVRARRQGAASDARGAGEGHGTRACDGTDDERKGVTT